MAVIKANAYGHGMIETAISLNKLNVQKPEYFGVALTEEAVELRKNVNCKQPILSFSPFNSDELHEYLKYNIIPSICSEREVKKLSLIDLKERLKVHINIDTGMGRLGIPFDESLKIIKKLFLNKKVLIDGIYTHFATSDEYNKSYAKIQLKRFNRVISELKSEGIKTGVKHAANSGAILDLPDSYFDMVRPGISLYGYFPSLETTESINLKPVLSIKSKVTSVKTIRKNESVSYGRKFIAKENTKVITIPIGYADGISRKLSNNMHVIIRDKIFKQVGRVTMDRISINIGSEKVNIGDNVILLGSSKNHKIYAWDWAEKLGTIPYEIICNISARVPRVYK